MKASLLSHIASSFISEYENVANSSICYLLNEYSAARDALKKVLPTNTVPTNYKTELAAQSGGRPDVTGVDADGNKHVIIEGKFWANLTENQPNRYLKELVNGGRLLFLAPDQRIESLKLELEKRTGVEDNNILVVSWNDFLSTIERENVQNHDADLAGDLAQLKALCNKMDVEGMPPLSLSDLSPMNGRIAKQFVDVVDECHGILKHWEHADFIGLKKTPYKYGYGFYFRGHGFGCCLYFSSYDWYLMDNHAPVWLDVKEHSFGSESKRINAALNSFDPKNTYENSLGIVLEPGMDKDQVVDRIVEKVKDALEHIHARVINTGGAWQTTAESE